MAPHQGERWPGSAGTTREFLSDVEFVTVGTWRRIQAALRREKADLGKGIGEFEARAHAALDQKERELNATPGEKLALEQKRAAELDAEMDGIRKRIEGG